MKQCKRQRKNLEEVKIEDEVTDVVCEAVRPQYGSQIWTAWQVPGLPGIPGMPQYQALSGKDRGGMSEMRKRRCASKDEKRQKVLWMRG